MNDAVPLPDGFEIPDTGFPKFPTYGTLLQLKQLADGAEYWHQHPDVPCSGPQMLLSKWVTSLFPAISVQRPGRFYQTVERLALPTTGNKALRGLNLDKYLKRTWTQRNTRTASDKGDISALEEQGLSPELLDRMLSGQDTWQLTSTPPRQFYIQLHSHLKQKGNLSKGEIGAMYTKLDPHFESYRSDYAYRVIDKMCKAKTLDRSAAMTYYNERSPKYSTQVRGSSKQAEIPNPRYLKKNVDRREARRDKKLAQIQQSFHNTQLALQELQRDATETQEALMRSEQLLEVTRAQLHQEQRQCSSLQEHETDLTGMVEELMAENVSLREAIQQLEEELNQSDLQTYGVEQQNGSDTDFVVTTTSGKRYSNAVRELYYRLLSKQIPPAKIPEIIIAVLKIMVPSVDVESIKLPKRSSAAYMRNAELPTLNSAHKATVLAKASQMHMNTDGTTLNQQKVNAIAVNGICLSVDEVPDGTAESVLEHIDRELDHLREIAHRLKVPEADSINWTRITSSTTDGASTQKRVNKLTEEYRERDRQKFGNTSSGTAAIHLVQNFCGMHLGVNLRKAQNAGVRQFYRESEQEADTEDTNLREYEPGDRFVYEFCKLFGEHGTPEYGHGVLDFPDFLKARAEAAEASGDTLKASLYREALSVKLHRQVGSRYFVSASNAARAFYLAPMATEYLQELSYTKDLNKLEKEVQKKLGNPSEIAQLKLDGLFYYHVYADLMMLIKSNDLDKSVLDMNTHYLELKTSLNELSHHPEQALDPNYMVFPSEQRLYTQQSKQNHRKHKATRAVYKRLLTSDEWDKTLLLPRVTAAATAMKEKLVSYKQDQLPGGKYWDPDEGTKGILKQLKPQNDICESLLGLNDWLTPPLVNAKQHTKTALIESKRNKTMAWLDTLSTKDEVIDLAVAERRAVQRRNLLQEKETREKRIARKKEVLEKGKQKQARAQAMERELENAPHITSEEELEQALQVIEEKRYSARECEAEKTKLLKLLIRKQSKAKKRKVLFSINRKPKTFIQLKQDFLELLSCIEPPSKKRQRVDFKANPSLLVGQRIRHKFIEDGEEVWYEGYVVAYDDNLNTHEVVYTEDSEHYSYNLLEDLEEGSLEVLHT